MYIPIRRRLPISQIFLACAAGVGATIYVWAPILKEQANKRQKGIEDSTQESQSKPQQQPKS